MELSPLTFKHPGQTLQIKKLNVRRRQQQQEFKDRTLGIVPAAKADIQLKSKKLLSLNKDSQALWIELFNCSYG